MKSSATLSIGAAAEHFGLPAHVLRHWESMGLLSPARAAGGRRRYGPDDLHRIAAILVGKDAGLALTDIRDILTVTGLEERRAIQRRHRDELMRRMARIQAALDLIEGGLTCTYDDITACPAYGSLVAERMGASAH